MSEAQPLSGPDLAAGVAIDDIGDGKTLLGHADGEAVVLVRRGDEFYAVGAACSHYGGPLHQGLIVGDAIRCPWHHACFSLRTGEALRPPALAPVACWTVVHEGERVLVRARRSPPRPRPTPANAPASVVVVGAGAAGQAAVETLRREGYKGPVTLIGAEPTLPVDRPNLSKDYLAGNAPEEWMLLRPASFYEEEEISVLTGAVAASINREQHRVTLADGRSIPFGALLLATGAAPVRLDLSGGSLPHVHYLRTLADSRAIIAGANAGGNAVVLGASFIGLEVAASLRARGLAVHVVAPEGRPLERIMGPAVGDFVRALHESHGVVFHLGDLAAAIGADAVTLKSGVSLPADLVVIGAGVRPAAALAEQAGLAVDRGILVDEYLETSVRGVFAAGDVARYPDPRSGERVRIEHWVVAQRQGRTAAWNILGRRTPFDAVPFFWSQHYDVVLNYVGHAERWDSIEMDGDLEARDCAIRYIVGGRVRAVVTVGRDAESLRAEATMERALSPDHA